MKTKRITSLLVALGIGVCSFSQSVPSGYTVGTWSGFRNSAATFTFDDGCANQSTATATLDEYGYKASFYPPTSWVSNWSVFQTRVNNGHEVGSHSVNHGNTMPDSEIQQSKSIINNNVTGQDCNTITYPNCNEPSESVLKQYYIGGRICNGQVEGPTPSNYYQIGSLICGNQGSYNSLSSFQTAFTTAINKNGWAVFLIHEIDNGNGQANGYSPLSSSLFEQVVSYVHDNDSKIWLTTFRNAILYSQERDKLSLTETAKSSTQYTLSASVSITSSIVTYDFPITVRRVMPSGWTNFAASQNGKDIAVKTITSGGKTYAQFDVVPGKTYTLEDRESEYTEEGEEEPENTSTNGISNGEFDSGTSGWAIQNNENAKGTMTAVTNANLSGKNAVSICPDGNSGTEAWHIQMYQNVTLKPNTTYSYTFTAKAASARNLVVMVQKVAADYDTYDWQQFSLTTTAQNFSSSFTTPSDAAADSKIAFCIGGADGCVYIDNIVFNVPSSGGGGGNSSHYETDACTHTTKLSGGTTLTQSSGGGHNIPDNEFNYELWFDGSNGGASMTYFGGENDCAFKASWNNCGDYLARVGFYYGGGSTKTYKDYDNIHAEFNYKDSKSGNGGGSYSYIGVYGWTLVPNEIEFYIVEDSFTPNGGGMYYGSQVVGTYECDGATYTLRVGQRNNAPSISGTSTFKQIFAVRSSFRECGHISVSEHFKNWEKNGITLGNMYDCKLLCEVGGGSGSIEYTYATMYYGDPKDPEDPDEPDNPENPGTIDVSGDLSKYFIDKAYVGPSCDALKGEEVNGGAYYTGEYTNLFTKYLGKTQAQVDEKMQNLWKHFFTVNGQNTVYYETNNNMAYIYDTGNQDVRTEGMSYGLMICVQMGDRDKFDKIWRWAKKYMQYKKGDQREGLFAWQCETNGNIKGASCAPDGEMYFLTALWFASHRWGNDGDINYEEEAQYLANQILNKPGRSGGQVSPIFNFSNHIVTFGETSYQFTDPSYNLPGFLELWARWSNTNKDFWAQAPAAARTLLQKASNSKTGLFPDYSQFDGTPYRPDWAGYDTRQYKYDASRSAMNVGMDYNWFAADEEQPKMMSRLLNFFKNDNFSHGYYNWDGTGGEDYYNQAMHGSNGVAVFALKNEESLAKTYVQRLWDAQVPTGQWRYYNGMVYFLSMLHASGYFKIYKPMPEIITKKLSGPAPVTFNGVDYTKDTTFQALVDCEIYDVTITIEAPVEVKHTVIFKDYDGKELKSEEVVEGEAATAPTNPTRTGYTFKEWNADFTNVTEDLVVTAVYEINTYKVTFVDYDGSTLKEQTVEYGSAATAPTDPTRTGYIFKEWDKDFSAVTEVLTVTATYTEIEKFTVVFQDYDGTELKSEKVEKGKSATAPTNPTRSGYTFVGWDIDFDNITKDIVVKATYNQNDSGSKYEAENATIANGASVSSNGSASGGKYVRMQEGKLTFNVNVTNAGMYNVKIAYSLTEDYKAQFLTVNGSQVGTVAFNQSGTSNPTFASVDACVMLNAGANTIGLEKSWGYVDIDYIEISTYERTSFNIDEALVTPNPQPAAAEIYEFLKDNFGKKSISGVMTLDVLNNYDALPLASQAEVSYIKTNSGKYPAIVGFDFMHSTGKNSTNDWQKAYTTAIIAMAKELWDEGGIPTFSWHWRDPNQNGDDFYTDKCSFNLTNAFTNSSCSAWNTNSTEYKNIVKDIDVIAGYLQQLQCEGVSVLWRPVHEASGAWFWWGSKGATAYKQLYKLIFDRLVNYHGLHNLIWVWNSDGTDADWYPGDEFVDVVGRDFYYGEGATYNHSSLVCDYEALAKQTEGKKIITLAENGAVPYPENMDNDGALWSWFMPWYGDYVTSDNHNKKSDWNTIMNDSRVITLDDMKGWDNRTKIYDTTTVGTVYSKYGFSITPSAEGDSENELTVKSKQGCDSTIVLFLHANAKDIVEYTVTFVDYDDSEISKQTVEEGEDATAPTEPTRDGYTFSGWDKEFTNVTSDLIVKAQYTEKGKADYTALNAAIANAEKISSTDYTATSISALNEVLIEAKAVEKDLYADSQSVIDAATTALQNAIKALVPVFTVTFVDYDGKELSVQTVESGKSAVAPSNPTREGYVFDKWDTDFSKVTATITVKAVYATKDKADYSALNAAISNAESKTESNYSSTSWKSLQEALTSAKSVDKDLFAENQKIVDDATVALQNALSSLIEVFTVTFVDYDGKELDSQVVEKGKSANAPSNPTRENYEFSGWVGSYENVTAHVTVTASYTEKGKANYTELDNAILAAENKSSDQAMFTDNSWSTVQTALTAAKGVDRNLFAEDQNVIDDAKNALLTALSGLSVKSFSVKFVADGQTISEQTIEYGKSATAPSNPTKAGYDFVKWVGDYSNVTKDLTITAEFAEKGKADYSELDAAIQSAENVDEEQYSASSLAILQSALDGANNVSRDLLAEDQSVVDAATDALQNAIKALSLKTFTVTFVADGNVVAEKTVEYGKSTTVPSSPTKVGYDFVKWNGDFSEVTSNITIVAEFTVQTFIVTFVDYNGSELSKQTVEYGKSAQTPVEQPQRAGYEFSGWVGTYENVTANVTITASYTEKGKAVYTALDNAIAAVLMLPESKYSADSWADLQSALADANKIDRNLEEKDQNIVDAAAAALNDAIKNLKLNIFVVKFIVDGNVVDEQQIEYGGSATIPTSTPEKAGYDFVRWNGSYTNIVSNISIVAEFKAKATADYSLLDATIARANAVESIRYDELSLAKLQSALNDAKNVDRNLFAEGQSVVDEAIDNLQSALNGLVYKTFLVQFVVDNVVVSSQNVEYGKSAIAPANPIKNGFNFVKWNTNYSYVTSELTIVAEFTEKPFVTIDKSILNSTINEANNTIEKAEGNTGNNPGQYPSKAVLDFQSAIDKAQSVYDNATTQTDVDNEVLILEEAIKEFIESINPENVDFKELNSLIKHANSLLDTTSVGTKPGQYPLMENWDLTNAVLDAKELIAKTNVKQYEVNEEVKALRTAIESYLNSVIPDLSPINTVESNQISVYSKGHYVVVENVEISDVEIYDITGRCVSKNGANAVSSSEIYVEKTGVYVVRIGGFAQRVVIK